MPTSSDPSSRGAWDSFFSSSSQSRCALSVEEKVPELLLLDRAVTEAVSDCSSRMLGIETVEALWSLGSSSNSSCKVFDALSKLLTVDSFGEEGMEF